MIYSQFINKVQDIYFSFSQVLYVNMDSLFMKTRAPRPVKICDGLTLCPLENFLERMDKYRITEEEWYKQCNITYCDSTQPDNSIKLRKIWDPWNSKSCEILTNPIISLNWERFKIRRTMKMVKFSENPSIITMTKWLPIWHIDESARGRFFYQGKNGKYFKKVLVWSIKYYISGINKEYKYLIINK